MRSVSVFICLLLLVPLIGMSQGPLEILTDGVDSLKAVEGEHVKKFYALPIISASPETSLRVGAVGVWLFRKKGVAEETQLSSIRIPISYTINNQFRAKAGGTYYSDANKHIFKGEVEWFKFPLLFYGIGNNTQPSDEEIYTTQTLVANLSYLKSLGSGLFIGLGYNYFNSHIVKFEEDGSLAQDGLIPGNMGSITSGINLNFRYDTRDNNLSAATGLYLDAKLATYEPWLGSKFDFTRLDMDFRKFFNPFGKHVLGLQLVLANIWGDPSFETMSLLGGNSIMRGHYQGRFRDNTLYATQVEYRIPIGRENWIDTRKDIPFKDRWGLVGFFGVGDVASSVGDVDFNSIKTSFGVGVRYLVLPKERINIRIDFGFGTQVPGVYFNIREAF